jgi:hypothetical protein
MAINYTEKGNGLHNAIAAAGLSLWQEGNAWKTGPGQESAVQAIIDSYTLAQAKAVKKAQSLAIAKSLRDKVVAAISPGEMASWPIKRDEALRYSQTGNAADAPLLSMEAQARGITLAAMMTRVASNAASFAAAEAAIGGADGRHRDAIDKLLRFEDVADYNLNTGWPEV